jgi:hypothetical protein
VEDIIMIYKVRDIESFKQIIKLFTSTESIELRCHTTITIHSMLLSNASSIRVEIKADPEGILTSVAGEEISVCLNTNALLTGIENVMRAFHIIYYTFVVTDTFVIQAYDKNGVVSISTVRVVENPKDRIDAPMIEFQNSLGLSLEMISSGLAIGGKHNIIIHLKPHLLEFEVADILVSSKISFPISGMITANYRGVFVKTVNDLMRQFVKCILITKYKTKKRKLDETILVRTHVDGPLNLAYVSGCINMSIFSGPIQE